MWFLRFSNSANDYKKRTLQPYPIGYWTVFCYTVENRGGEIRMKKEKAKRYYLTKMLTSYILIVFILLICAFSSLFYDSHQNGRDRKEFAEGDGANRIYG